jgi:hypothetical protein
VVEGGVVKSDSLKSLNIIPPLAMPPVECIFVEEPQPEGSYGAKGVGEIALVPTASAVAGALHAFEDVADPASHEGLGGGPRGRSEAGPAMSGLTLAGGLMVTSLDPPRVVDDDVVVDGRFVDVEDIELDIVHDDRAPRRVPIHIGATGMKMTELAGEIADGVVLNYMPCPGGARIVTTSLRLGRRATASRTEVIARRGGFRRRDPCRQLHEGG